jgi:tetratricopeptide (TPR) repeat protein
VNWRGGAAGPDFRARIQGAILADSMSGYRRDPHKAKLRRDRSRRARHDERLGRTPPPDIPPSPALLPRFAAERSMREVQALLEGQEFGSDDDLNARLAELTRGGRLAEMANAWKRDDPKWRAQEMAYDALEASDPMEALRLVHGALKLDPDCTEAQHLMVSMVPMDMDSRIRLMRETVDKAERNMGESFIRENTGHFWSTLSTRPYMRAKRELGELLAAAGRLADALAIFEQMLELNPGDNQGARYPLLGLYLATNQPERASNLIARFPEEERRMGSFAWARVLERWLSGRLDEAEAALERSRKVNPFAERYISGAQPLPEEAPQYYRPGEESEAQICALELAPAWERYPGFREWLRGQSRPRD